MIREATHEDLGALLTLGEAFHAASHWSGLSEFRPEVFVASVRAFVDSPDFGVFVSPRGFIIVAACPLWFSGDLTAQELCFWAPDGCGDGLRRAAEAWAAGKQIRPVLMGAHEPGETDRIATWYRRAGYEPHGRVFRKVLRDGN